MATGVMGDRERIILADFVDRSGDSSLAYAVTEAFRVDLSQSPSVRLVQTTELNDAFARMNRPVPAVMTVDLAREVAQREGFRAVVAGEIHEVGASFVISAQLLGAESGEVLVPLRETAGDSSGIIAAVDRLSSRLRERIGESLRSIRRSAALERVTTASLPALRKFSQATRAVEASQPALAIAFFKEAIALDTAFAAAHRGLAIVLRNWGIDRALAARSMSNAYRFRDRLTESERLWTTGTYHMTRNEAQQALVPYLELLEREPSNARVLNNIGVLYSVGQDNQRALEYYLRAHEAEPGNTSATFNIVVTLLDLGLIDSARAVNRRFAERAPGHPLVHAHDYIINSVTMEYDSADAAVDRWAPSIDESSAAVLHTVRIRLAGVRGRSSRVHAQLGEAESRARAGRQVPEFLRMAIEAALYDLTTRGTPGSALARLDGLLTAFPLDGLEPVDRPYLELADAYARAGRADRAREYVAAFDREVIDEYKPLAETAYDLALGSVALAMQDAEAAVAAFRRAGRIGCRVCALPGLARAYELRGELDSALAMYERYVRTPDDDRTNTDYVELPRSYVRLGELFEARGAREQAVEYYNRFVELWSTADAELEPLVDDIRQRIARLVAEGR
jgi:tetratricopeptide (TPR) repeat protein